MQPGRGSFFRELHRRKVYSSAVAYIVIAWLLLQVADLLLPIYDAPEWLLRMFSSLLFLGFPAVIVVAWFYDFSLSGIVRTLSGSEELAAKPPKSQIMPIELPDGPSIAVLPLRNLTEDSGQDYFAEALGNDIVTGLTQSSNLFVLAAAATAGYADQEQDIVSVGRGLGVMYLLRGSVQKSGGSLRVSAQLMDTATGVQIWSENYDRALTAEALFAVQDDIRERIVATLSDLHGVIYSAHGKRHRQHPTSRLNAYECLAVALAYDKYISAETHLRARESLERAVQIDPQYDSAWAHLSWVYTDEWAWGFNPLPDAQHRARDAAQRGLRLAPDNYHNHWLMSRVHYFMGELDQFQAEVKRALALNSADGTTLGLIGMYTAWTGDWEQGLEMMDKARQLNPNYPDYYHIVAGSAEFYAARFQPALEELLKAKLPEWPLAQLFLAATYTKLGQLDLAAQHTRALRAIGGPDSTESAQRYLHITFPFLPDFVTVILQDVPFDAPE
jgi:adenylate cyclase